MNNLLITTPTLKWKEVTKIQKGTYSHWLFFWKQIEYQYEITEKIELIEDINKTFFLSNVTSIYAYNDKITVVNFENAEQHYVNIPYEAFLYKCQCFGCNVQDICKT